MRSQLASGAQCLPRSRIYLRHPLGGRRTSVGVNSSVTGSSAHACAARRDTAAPARPRPLHTLCAWLQRHVRHIAAMCAILLSVWAAAAAHALAARSRPAPALALSHATASMCMASPEEHHAAQMASRHVSALAAAPLGSVQLSAERMVEHLYAAAARAPVQPDTPAPQTVCAEHCGAFVSPQEAHSSRHARCLSLDAEQPAASTAHEHLRPAHAPAFAHYEAIVATSDAPAAPAPPQQQHQTGEAGAHSNGPDSGIDMSKVASCAAAVLIALVVYGGARYGRAQKDEGSPASGGFASWASTAPPNYRTSNTDGYESYAKQNARSEQEAPPQGAAGEGAAAQSEDKTQQKGRYFDWAPSGLAPHSQGNYNDMLGSESGPAASESDANMSAYAPEGHGSAAEHGYKQPLMPKREHLPAADATNDKAQDSRAARRYAEWALDGNPSPPNYPDMQRTTQKTPPGYGADGKLRSASKGEAAQPANTYVRMADAHAIHVDEEDLQGTESSDKSERAGDRKQAPNRSGQDEQQQATRAESQHRSKGKYANEDWSWLTIEEPVYVQRGE